MIDILKIRLENYKNITISNDFTQIFNNGLIFCALLHSYNNKLLNYDELDPKNQKHNLQLAFKIAEQELGIVKLIDENDFDGIVDELSVMTYLGSLLEIVSVITTLFYSFIFSKLFKFTFFILGFTKGRWENCDKGISTR